jgi:hypothetical protein
MQLKLLKHLKFIKHLSHTSFTNPATIRAKSSHRADNTLNGHTVQLLLFVPARHAP